jgi:hypothetical protein
MASRYNNTHIITNRPSQQASNMSMEPSLPLLYNRHQASAAKAVIYNVLAIFVSSGGSVGRSRAISTILLKQQPFQTL